MCIQDRINDGEFETKLPYPSPDKLVTSNIIYQSKQKEIVNHNKRIGALRLELKAIETEMRNAYQEDENQKVLDFRHALEEDFGVTKHHKRETLWNLAWDRGHRSGLAEVYNEYQDLVVLLI